MSKKKGKRKRNRQGGDTSMDNVVPFQPNQEDTEVLVTEEPVAEEVAEEVATEEVAPEPAPPAQLVRLTDVEQHVGFPTFAAYGIKAEDITMDDLIPPISYVFVGQGVMVFRDSGAMQVLVESPNGISGLPEVKERVKVNTSHMPKDMVLSILGFFEWAEKKHSAEAIVLLYYNKGTKEWHLEVPKQKVGAGSAHYDMPDPNDIPDGFALLGTWHSHGNMSAFHSTTDDNDEEKMGDGIHLTAGSFHSTNAQQSPTVVCSVMVNRRRWTLDPRYILDVPILDHKVDAKKETVPYKHGKGTYVRTSAAYNETRIKPAQNDALDFPEEWTEQVTATAPFGFAVGSARSIGGVGGGRAWDDYDDDYQTVPRRHRTPDVSCFSCGNYFGSSDRKILTAFVQHLEAGEYDHLAPEFEKWAMLLGSEPLLPVIENDDLMKELLGFSQKVKEVFEAQYTEPHEYAKMTPISFAPRMIVGMLELFASPERREFLKLFNESVKGHKSSTAIACMCPVSAVNYEEPTPLPTNADASKCYYFSPNLGWTSTYDKVKDAYVRSWEGYQEHVGWAKDYDSPKVIGGEERDEVQEWLESQKGHNAEASCDTCISWWASVAKHQFDDELPADALIRAVDTCTTWDLLLEQAAKNNVDVQSLLSDAKEHTIAMTCSFYESEDSYFNTVEPPKQPVKDEPSSKAMEDFKAANPHLFEVKQESAPLVVLGSEDKAREMTEKLEDNVDALAKRIEANIQSITQNATDKDYSDIEVID